MVRVLDSGSSGPGSGSGPGTLCCVLGQGTLLSRCPSPARCINEYRRKCRGSPWDGLPSHPGGVEILLVSSCYGNRR